MITEGWAQGESQESEESSEETKEVVYSLFHTNTEVQKVIRTTPVCDFIYTQHLNSRRAKSEVKMCQLILVEIRPVAYLQEISLWNKF